MEQIELDFIESAKKLRDSYKLKLADLERIITGWQGDSSARSPRGTVKAIPPIQVRQENGQSASTPEPSDSATDWIRYAIQLDPEHISNPGVLAKIRAASPEVADKITSGRVSTQLYHLAKSEQLAVVNKVPGGPSEYRITEKYKAWAKVSGTWRKLN